MKMKKKKKEEILRWRACAFLGIILIFTILRPLISLACGNDYGYYDYERLGDSYDNYLILVLALLFMIDSLVCDIRQKTESYEKMLLFACKIVIMILLGIYLFKYSDELQDYGTGFVYQNLLINAIIVYACMVIPLVLIYVFIRGWIYIVNKDTMYKTREHIEPEPLVAADQEVETSQESSTDGEDSEVVEQEENTDTEEGSSADADQEVKTIQKSST